MKFDYELEKFAAEGAPPLPLSGSALVVESSGARIWAVSIGEGEPVVLLHGGLGHSGNWGYQVPALLDHGYRVILIDSRGHGRSTRDEKPYSYELMALDVAAVLEKLNLKSVSIIGWSDGACVALVLASVAPSLVERVLFFACNMDPSGTKTMVVTSALERCFSRHRSEYKSLSETPNEFDSFVEAVSLMMKTQPNYSRDDLASIAVPVLIVLSSEDEFIKLDHALYLSRTLPHGRFVPLTGVSHFAPLQDPKQFNEILLKFLERNSLA